jgi:hypothetical protein
MIGTRLVHYEITGHLGSGGMGEVSQATDLKLGRSVAIKLLPKRCPATRNEFNGWSMRRVFWRRSITLTSPASTGWKTTRGKSFW